MSGRPRKVFTGRQLADAKALELELSERHQEACELKAQARELLDEFYKDVHTYLPMYRAEELARRCEVHHDTPRKWSNIGKALIEGRKPWGIW